MKLALCFTGHMRTYKQTYASWKKYVIDPYKPDIFIDTWSTIGPWISKGVPDRPPASEPGTVLLDSDTVSKIGIEELYNPISMNIEDYSWVADKFTKDIEPIVEWRNSCDKSVWGYMPQSHYAQLYKWWSCNRLKINHEINVDGKYDLVIRSRTDLQLSGQMDSIIHMAYSRPHRIYTPIRNDLSDPIHMRDVFFLGSSECMNILCDMYNNYHLMFDVFKELGNTQFFDNHKLLPFYLLDKNIPWQELPIPIAPYNHCLIR